MDESEEILKAKLNSETAKIAWSELQRYFARGVVVCVGEQIDLIDVAMQFSKDNKQTVTTWLKQGVVFKPSDKDAKHWLENNTVFWAVVVAPWVLIQEI